MTALILAVMAAAASPVYAQDDRASLRAIACWDDAVATARNELADTRDLAEDLIELTTKDADIAEDGTAVFENPVELRSRDRLLRAGSARYDSEAGTFTAGDGVELRDLEGRFGGDSAVYNTRTGQLDLNGAHYEIPTTPARGSAERIQLRGSGVVKLDDVTYTACPPGNDSWSLSAGSIKLDPESGMGTAKRAVLRFQGVPFLYVPYFTYPITDDRKSGLLFPSIGSSDSRGFEVTQPIYWNIAPNYDATFAPRYMSDRGLQLGVETRLLTRNNDARLYGDFLPDDNKAGLDRWQFDLDVVTMLPFEWRATTEAGGVSDNDYFEDLSARESWRSRTNLDRSITFEHYDSVWSLVGRLQGFQTIDSQILPDEEPYLQLPQFIAKARWLDNPLGLDYGFDGEANYFYRDDSVTGARVHLQPSVELPLERNGIYLRPSLALDHTFYTLQDQAAGTDDNPSRTAPIAKVDVGAIFERTTGASGQYLMTLEPRALYAYIPERDQSDLPVFDTIRPDFNLIQLYRYNRFIGYDRLSDSNQLSLGLTSRLLDTGSGRELLTATIGQTVFFDDGLVTLPGEIPAEEDSTDYIAELGIRMWKKWRIDLRYQYDTDTNSSARTSVRLRYRPGNFKAFNLGYRYAKDSLEQTDFSFSYPVTSNWNFIGRYNYSIPDKEALDAFLGVEYSSCCWSVSLLTRRSVIRSTDEFDTTIALQFALRGLSNFGSDASQDLTRDILGDTRF